MFTFAVMVLYLSSSNHPKHFDEEFLLRLAFSCFRTLNARPFPFFLLFVLLLVFLCSFQGAVPILRRVGGDKGSRTPDLLLARQALSQLSYAPVSNVLRATGRASKIE